MMKGSDMTKLKSDRLERLRAAMEGASAEDVATILSDAERAMKRAAKRREALPAEYERIELVQSRGPLIEFAGIVLADADWETSSDDPMRVALTLYETVAGNWIAAKSVEPIERRGYEALTARIIERRDDVQAMRAEVLEAFGWHDRARAMVRKQLGWSAVRVGVD